MFYVKNHKQPYIFDPFAHLGEKRRDLLNKSWAGLFRQEILPVLPVDALRKHYHDCQGRLSKELYSMVGLMILQQMHDLTDEEAVEQFSFNIKWHYALNITSNSDQYSYVSLKSLWSMRDILTSEGLYHTIFDAATTKLAMVFKVDFTKQRMDSVHIRSNMRHLGRISLFAKTIKKFLANLKRHHRLLFDKLDSTLTARYLNKKEEAIFSIVKPSESARTLDQLAQDIFLLVERFTAVETVNSMSSFKLLVRLFEEQCLVAEQAESGQKLATAKPNKDVASDSLQNPSDPDAGYSGHKGKGYQVQVAETYSPEPDKENLSLITYIEVESADKNDANALLPALVETARKDMAPIEILADSLYGSDDNVTKAEQEHGVQVIAPAMGTANHKGLSLADFTLNEQGEIISCPQGCTPATVKHKKGNHGAAFQPAVCRSCPRQEECPAKEGKKAFSVRYKEKDIRLARRRQHEQSPEFGDKYRFRAGVEATMSEYSRRTGVKQLRVRGLKAVTFAAVLKALGLNIFRAATALRKKKNGGRKPFAPEGWAIYGVIGNFKEQIVLLVSFFVTLLASCEAYENFGQQNPN
ncbi:MAG: transposase [Nitrospirae bacterium]|nr:transposase [Nitrospirota bacterium]